MDIITQSKTGLTGSGAVAQRLLASNFDVGGLRTADILRKEEWVLFDTKVVEIARQRLVAIGDLISKGLTLPISNALGTTIVQWEQVSDMDPAELSMSGVTPGQEDRIKYLLKSLPLPITHKDFRINIRALEASRKLGETLDTTQAALATRLVSEQIEGMLFNGATVVAAGATIYGYTTEPNRNTGSVTASWALGTTTGEQIVTDIIEMIGIANGDNMYGPYTLYVPTIVYARFGDDYKAASDRTILERIRAIPEIVAVRGSSNLTASNVLMVQLTSDVVDVVDGIQPTPVMWESNGGFTVNFKVMGIMIPRVKSDMNGQSGIVHYS